MNDIINVITLLLLLLLFIYSFVVVKWIVGILGFNAVGEEYVAGCFYLLLCLFIWLLFFAAFRLLFRIRFNRTNLFSVFFISYFSGCFSYRLSPSYLLVI